VHGTECIWEEPKEAVRQFEEYFAGKRTVFDLPLDWPEYATPFQRQCWDALLTIPYGETRSYGQQAALLGKPGAARAVGQANHHNPLAIIVPCHRVIAADGGLGGYGGGLDTKQALLALEGAAIMNKGSSQKGSSI
jgi:methylated-DNA-[protein]-cysteine S-methyltransferase